MIRPFEKTDAQKIVRIHNKYIENFEFKLTEEFIINACSRESFKMLVFCDNNQLNEVLGFIGMLSTGCRRAEIGPIAVDDAHLRLKIGKSLMHEALNFMKERNIRRVISKVKSSNLESIKFFMSFGFVPEGLFEKYTPENETIIQMVKFLHHSKSFND